MAERHLGIDAGGHVLEPRNTWLDYLVDGRPLESMRNRVAHLGGIGLEPAELLTGRSRLRSRASTSFGRPWYRPIRTRR
jgi:hypothetical protein